MACGWPRRFRGFLSDLLFQSICSSSFADLIESWVGRSPLGGVWWARTVEDARCRVRYGRPAVHIGAAIGGRRGR